MTAADRAQALVQHDEAIRAYQQVRDSRTATPAQRQAALAKYREASKVFERQFKGGSK